MGKSVEDFSVYKFDKLKGYFSSGDISTYQLSMAGTCMHIHTLLVCDNRSFAEDDSSCCVLPEGSNQHLTSSIMMSLVTEDLKLCVDWECRTFKSAFLKYSFSTSVHCYTATLYQNVFFSCTFLNKRPKRRHAL